MDESFFKSETPITHTWGDRRLRKEVKISNNIGTIGVTDPRIGDHEEWMYEGIDSAAVNHFIHKLSMRFKDEEILLIMDNASYHRTQGSKEYQVPSNIHILFQPPYSPDVNYQEPVWKVVKTSHFKNHICKSYEELTATVNQIFWNLQDHKFIMRHWFFGILYKGFGEVKTWLRQR